MSGGETSKGEKSGGICPGKNVLQPHREDNPPHGESSTSLKL